MLSTLMTETFVAEYGNAAPADSIERHIARSYGAALVAEKLAAGRIEVWVLDAAGADDGLPGDAGYVQIGLDVASPPVLQGRRSLEVQRCYLRPQHIGGGGAGMLIGQAQRRALELDAQALFLSVYQRAPRAVRFYEKHGFRRAGALKYYIDAVEFDDWLMVWEAPGPFHVAHPGFRSG